jgi:hypothetical protein
LCWIFYGVYIPHNVYLIEQRASGASSSLQLASISNTSTFSYSSAVSRGRCVRDECDRSQPDPGKDFHKPGERNKEPRCTTSEMAPTIMRGEEVTRRWG